MAASINKLDGLELFTQGFSFRDIIGQDRWTAFTLIRGAWTDVGTPTVTAYWRDVGAQCFLQAKIVPATSVATTTNVSYIDLPRPAKGLAGEGSMQNLTTHATIGGCVVDTSNSRLYLPTWAASGNTILLWATWQI